MIVKKQKKIFIICSVKDADKKLRKRLERYAEKLEREGHKVHLPHRDTPQEDYTTGGFNILNINTDAIIDADEIHIFYDHGSHGSKFDLGSVWTLIRLYERGLLGRKKHLVIANRQEVVTPVELEKKNHFKALCYRIDRIQNAA